MNIRLAAVMLIAVGVVASCAKKPEATKPNERQDSQTADGEGENRLQPREEEIAEDCVAFLRATKARPAEAASGDCPGCSTPGIEVLQFQEVKTDRITCAATSCEVAVTIRASFNPVRGGVIGGGLTAWISPAQRMEFLRGQTPTGDQLYRVKITYRRTGEAWRAIEFDRADAK
jgi:hypothetical protein